MDENKIRQYLIEKYGAGNVKTGTEATEDVAGLYFGEPEAWIVLGTMPNSNEVGWFFAGYSSDFEN
jgi:hypothetical protein